jgi:hypothetical protein
MKFTCGKNSTSQYGRKRRTVVLLADFQKCQARRYRHRYPLKPIPVVVSYINQVKLTPMINMIILFTFDTVRTIRSPQATTNSDYIHYL